MFNKLFIVFLVAFFLQYLDAFVGMSFGGTTAILILLGFAPLESVMAVLLASATLSFFAGFLHHWFDNVDFGFEQKDLKTVAVLTGFGITGVLASVLVALHLPSKVLNIYIGLLVLVIGLIIIFRKENKVVFSWKKIILLGILAAFNKGMTGGGYGPVLASGQIISGIDSKKTVGITALSEAVVSSVGIILYLLLGHSVSLNWLLMLALLAGGVLSTPLAVYSTKKFHSQKIKYAIALISITLGLIIMVRNFF